MFSQYHGHPLHGRHKDFPFLFCRRLPGSFNKWQYKLLLFITLADFYSHFSSNFYDIHTGHQVDLDYLNWFEAANLASSISKV
jgi:hypothetical protein